VIRKSRCCEVCLTSARLRSKEIEVNAALDIAQLYWNRGSLLEKPGFLPPKKVFVPKLAFISPYQYIGRLAVDFGNIVAI
jgi:hypothetical protein